MFIQLNELVMYFHRKLYNFDVFPRKNGLPTLTKIGQVDRFHGKLAIFVLININ